MGMGFPVLCQGERRKLCWNLIVEISILTRPNWRYCLLWKIQYSMKYEQRYIKHSCGVNKGIERNWIHMDLNRRNIHYTVDIFK